MSDLYRGIVYFAQHREVTSPKPHYLIVLNANPDSSEIIVFGVITSGVEQARKRARITGECDETIVELSPEDYAPLDHLSAVDCNSPVKLHKWEFEACMGQLNAQRRSDVSPEICDAIVRGVLASRRVSEKIKKALRGLI